MNDPTNPAPRSTPVLSTGIELPRYRENMTDILFFDHISGKATWLGAEDAKVLVGAGVSATTTAEGMPARDEG